MRFTWRRSWQYTNMEPLSYHVFGCTLAEYMSGSYVHPCGCICLYKQRAGLMFMQLTSCNGQYNGPVRFLWSNICMQIYSQLDSAFILICMFIDVQYSLHHILDKFVKYAKTYMLQTVSNATEDVMYLWSWCLHHDHICLDDSGMNRSWCSLQNQRA